MVVAITLQFREASAALAVNPKPGFSQNFLFFFQPVSLKNV